jgi:hypothetical protein
MMKGISKKAAGLALALLVLIASGALAQWPTNPALNRALSVTSGEASVPHIASTSDGGCYVSWWDNTSGHYCMYMQRLNAAGEVMWAPNGMLISNHLQDTWLTDYTLTVDTTDCAILAINDLRAGGDWDIYAYRINPAGDFLWGADGLTISNDAFSDAFPQAKVTSAGNIVFAWNDISAAGVIRMRKVDLNGNDLWTPSIKVITSTNGVAYPRLAETNDDGIIMQLLVHQGPLYNNPYYIYAHKYDASGNDLWGSAGVLINNTTTVEIYRYPDIVSDMAGGALQFWYDARGNVNHAYGQHILAAGTVAWTANGVVVSTAAGQIQVEPTGFYNSVTSELFLFYINKNTDQNQWGVYGQKINSAGTRQWTNSGRALVAMSTQERGIVNACIIDSGAVVSYFEKPAGDVTNARVKAIRIDGAGLPVWSPSPVTMCSALSCKDDLRSCINPFQQVIAVWQDMRSDPDGDIYLQDINSNGSLGPLPMPLGVISGLVYEADGITPMSGAIIVTYDSLNAAVANDTTLVPGRFNVNVSPGVYHELFSKVGYYDTTLSNLAVVVNETTHVSMNMTSMPIIPGTIQGLVYDADGVTPLADVIIETHDPLDYLVAVDTTGAPGTYSLMIPPGSYYEFLTKPGYTTVTIDDIRVASDSITHVAALMNLAGSCHYVIGDANGSNTFTGLDVTYSVRYFKGGPPPAYSCECTPGNTWYVTGDVNGSCSFTGLDVTYMVRYFKGGAGPICCPSCPPTP